MPPISSRQALWRVLAPLLAIIFGIIMALSSRGYFEADEISHFLYAKAVWHDWTNLVHIWGRLGATALYALGAPLGPAGARLMAVGVMALTGWGTVRLLNFFLTQHGSSVAGQDGFFRRHASALIWLLLFAQPCFPFYCFTIMTEMLLACCWVWALCALCCRRVLLAGILIGLGGLMRPEGWIAIATWPVYLLLIRRHLGAPPAARPGILALFLSTILAGVPTLAWYLLGVVARHDFRWFIADWPWSPGSQYGRTGLLFLGSGLIAMAGWMWIPVVRAGFFHFQQRRTAPLGWYILVLPCAGFFLLHATLGAFGLFGSMSLPRYFLVVSPLLAILAVQGLMLFEQRQFRWLSLAAIALSVLPTIALACLGYLPMRPLVEQARLDVAINAFETRHASTEQLITGHPYVCLRLGIDPDAPSLSRVFHRDQIASAPPGTLLITDAMVWVYEGRPTADELRAWGFREDPQVTADVDVIPNRFEFLTLKPPGEGHVRLWIKQ